MPELTEMPSEIHDPIAVLKRLVDEKSRWVLIRVKSGALEGDPIDMMGREVSEFWYLLNSEGEKPVELQVRTGVAKAIARESMLVIEDKILGSSVVYVATDELRERMKGGTLCPLCHEQGWDATTMTSAHQEFMCYNAACPVMLYPNYARQYPTPDWLLNNDLKGFLNDRS